MHDRPSVIEETRGQRLGTDVSGEPVATAETVKSRFDGEKTETRIIRGRRKKFV